MGVEGRTRRIAALTLAGVLLVAACSSTTAHPATTTTTVHGTGPGTTGPVTTGPGTTGPTTTVPGQVTPVELSLKGVRLGSGHAQAAATPTPLVDGSPLDDAAVRQIEARLPQWTLDPSITQAFHWPAQSLTVPRAGATIDTTFPAATQEPPVQVPNGPMHVLRHQPDGEVSIAPFVTITFDQPMVPITTLGQLDQASVPATISPAIPGHWQWIGTQTLRFDAASDLVDRLPMATEFTVTVPAGTTSATGGALADAVTFNFATPALTVQSFAPQGDSLPLTPVFVATFDQRVDQAAVLATTTLTATGHAVPVRLATAAEIAADDSARQLTASAPEGRWLAFRAVDPLPTDAALTISIGPATPSAEGPRTTAAATTFDTHTYSPLNVIGVECAGDPTCPPGNPIYVTTNNAIDPATFDPSLVTVDPAIPGQQVSTSGNTIVVGGATVANTTYRVTVAASLTDVFGQRLGAAVTRPVTIGPPTPTLQAFQQMLTTLDPLSGSLALDVTTVAYTDLRIRVLQVDPAQWPAYTKWATDLSNSDPTQPAPAPPSAWHQLADRTVKIDGPQDRAIETPVDLSSWLPGGHGQVVVIAQPTAGRRFSDDERWMNRPTATWVQATSIGLDAVLDRSKLTAWTTDLRTGAPLANVAVRFLDVSGAATTDEDGLAGLTLPGTGTLGLVATSGDDTAILPSGYYWDGGGWQRQGTTDQALWYVIDDRGIYRSGETVSVKGIVRQLTSSGDAQIDLLHDGATVDWTAHDAVGNQIATGTAKLGALGGFDLSFAIPAGANLGQATIELQLPGSSLGGAGTTHVYQIEEFRRPEFTVAARHESADPAVLGTPLTVAADATYYAGGPLADAAVSWQVTTAAASYAPPGWDEFTFGRWVPWWESNAAYGGGFADGAVPCCVGQGGSTTSTFTGTTDASGTHYLQVEVGDLGTAYRGLPVTVSAIATVTDVNRQAIASTTSVLVHPASNYVGLRSAATFVHQGDAILVDAIVTDIDGKAVAGRVAHLVMTRSEWTWTNGQYAEHDVEPQTCDITSASAPQRCSFTTSVGGQYTITATVVDDQGRTSTSTLTRWVDGGEVAPSRSLTGQSLTLVPDHETYEPGTTASLLVQSPITEGDGLLVVSRGDIRTTQRFAVHGGSATVTVPVADADIPGLDVQVEVVGTSPRTADDGSPLAGAPAAPAYATGQLHLAVSIASRTLTVTATPKDPTTTPGATTSLDVSVTDHGGAPVAGSELAVVVVDEAVLALSSYHLQDPLGAFYASLPSYVQAGVGRASIVLPNPLRLAGADGQGGSKASATTAAAASTTTAGGPTAAAPRAAGAADESAAPGSSSAPVDVRTNFDALALFTPSVVTDANGKATVEVKLPDNLTRYRVMVVAVDGPRRFGTGESAITARLPLMVRPSAPRFANFGDHFELPVVVQNQTDASMTVDLVLQTDNLSIDAASTADDAATLGVGRTVTVPANDRIEARFAVSAAQVGTARFRVTAVQHDGDASDSATVELPVYTPSTTESFATYGVVDDGAISQPLLAPTGVIAQFGGLDITTSSTALQTLTDAVISVVDYPYDSSDALASQVLAIASLRTVLDAFDAPGLPSAGTLDAAVKDSISRLAALQRSDGGWPYWSGDPDTEPYNTIQVVHALVVAKAQGYTVPAGAIDQGLSYLRDIESHFPAAYDQATRDVLTAYALNVRNLAGDRDAAKAERLMRERGDQLPLDALAWLWPVVSDQTVSATIERRIQNAAVDTAGAVTFTTDVHDDVYVTLGSDRRTDGLILDALIQLRPQSDLIPKVVNGLLGGRVQGSWDSIQENSFILLAMKRYFDTFESQTPDFVARIWLGDRYAGEQQFAGRSTDRLNVSIPTSELQTSGANGITIAKDGTGRLYYRIGLRTAPSNLSLTPLDRGFVVARTYQAVDNPSDVTRDADGTWHVKLGARVRVTLTMVAESQRNHVALVDPLPAGLEILNTGLATTEPVPSTTPPTGPVVMPEGGVAAGGVATTAPSAGSVAIPFEGSGWWWGTWYDHENRRDDRAEAFASQIGAGSFEYTYVAKATTPGSFVVPPTRAEEMYAPETFGRSGTDQVVIG